MDEVCDIILGSIIKRRAEGSRYGVVVLAEGLIESMERKDWSAPCREDNSNVTARLIETTRALPFERNRIWPVDERPHCRASGKARHQDHFVSKTSATSFAAPIQFLSTQNTHATWVTAP